MVNKKMSDNKQFCGMFKTFVSVSEYNAKGKCRCLRCLGISCQRCKTYREKVAQIMEALKTSEVSRCKACRTYQK